MVTICVILYNSEEFVERFFKSLVFSIPQAWEVIFYDNHSTDNTIQLLEKLMKEKKNSNIRLIKKSSNRGYSFGVNTCVKVAKNETILLINPNSIVNPQSVLSLHKFYKTHTNSIVGGRYVSYHGSEIDTQPSAVGSTSFRDILLQLTNLGRILPFLPNRFWEHERMNGKRVAAVSAGFTFFSKKIFLDVGGFDDKYFMYLEDVDFCMQARRLGYEVYFYPEAKFQHFGGGSSKNEKHRYRREHWRNSRDYFFKKNYSLLEYGIFRSVDLLERMTGLI